MSWFRIACLCVALVGCASAYHLTPNAVALRSHMNAAKAEAVIAQSLIRGPDGRGGAQFSRGDHGNVTSTVFAKRTHVDHQRIKFWVVASTRPNSVPVSGAVVGTVAVDPDTDGCEPDADTKGEYVLCPHSLMLTSLDRVTVHEYQGRPADLQGPLVILKGVDHKGEGEHVEVSLPPEKLDEFLAAVMHLSPEARMTDGAGF